MWEIFTGSGSRQMWGRFADSRMNRGPLDLYRALIIIGLSCGHLIVFDLDYISRTAHS